MINKICRPKLPRAIARTRLFKLLDESRDHQTIWISGLAGAGKTTLVDSYLAARDLPCLWYQVDQRDADPSSFIYYMSLATKKASPRKRKVLPLLTPEYMLGLDTFALRYFEAAYQRLDPPVAVLIDNYQIIPSESPIHGLVLNGLSVIPKGVTVIIISRENPPPLFSRMLANQSMAHIDWRQLQLTKEETAAMANLQTGKTLSEPILDQLHEAAGGWAAGLALMLARADLEKVDLEHFQLDRYKEIFDYFGMEIFESEPAEIQDFLVKASLLPHMTISMAESISGNARTSQILKTLSRRNLFLERRRQRGQSFQFHPLFREFLQDRLHELYDETQLNDLRIQAATLLREEGDAEEAVAVLQNAGAWDQLSELIVKLAPELMRQGRNMSLLEWLKNLPRERISKSGWLLYWLGSCQSGFVPDQSRPILNQAFQFFKGCQDPVGMAMSWCALELDYFLVCSDYSPLDQLIEEVFDFLPRLQNQLPPDLHALLGFHIFSALNMRQPQHPRMEIYAEQVDRMIDLCPDINQRLIMGARLALYRCLQGELQKATRLVNILGPLARGKAVAPFARLAWLCGEASHAVTIGDFDGCLEIVDKGVQLSHETGIRVAEGTLLSMGAFALLAKDELKRAKAYLDRMNQAIIPGRFFEYALHRVQEALYYALQGASVQAMDAARAALDLALRSGAPQMELMSRYAIAQLLIDSGGYAEAHEALKRADELGEASKSPYARYMTLVYGAQLQFRSGNETKGVALLRDGLALGRRKRYFYCLWDRTDVLTDLYMKALQMDIETDYVREAIRRKGMVPEHPPLHIKNWPWPLKIYTLGRFSILKDDVPIQFPAKAQKKPMEMLKVLIAQGGQGVNKTRISDALWPDAEGDRAEQAFTTTLHRLRKLMGSDRAIKVQDGKVSLNSAVCWVDGKVFEHLLARADDALHRKDQDRAMAYTEYALTIYNGAFLAGDEWAPWAVSQRERLRSKFLLAVDRLGANLIAAGQWEKAAGYYHRSLDVDDLCEETYQHLMHCLRKLGRKSALRAIYQRCKNNLDAALGITPSDETVAIYQSALNGDR